MPKWHRGTREGFVESVAAADHATASNDDALVRLAASGSASAFDTLVATRLDRCYRLAFAILGDPSDAADATQEAFVSAWRQMPRLRDPGSFDGWLNRIVANSARMSRRGRTRRNTRLGTLQMEVRTVDGYAYEPADPAAGQQLDSVATSDAIGRAFDRISERDRLILALHHVEERPLAEIATSLGVAVGTVKWRLHQARIALEHAMEVEA
jgi:RNA polymerase sigma-70 factor (ECF subfamily)